MVYEPVVTTERSIVVSAGKKRNIDFVAEATRRDHVVEGTKQTRFVKIERRLG